MTDDVPVDLAFEGWLLPPAEGCLQCAKEHPDDWPHDAQSLHYQYFVYQQQMRWPNWGDAMAHCSQEMKDRWRGQLRAFGVEEERLWAPGELVSGD